MERIATAWAASDHAPLGLKFAYSAAHSLERSELFMTIEVSLDLGCTKRSGEGRSKNCEKASAKSAPSPSAKGSEADETCGKKVTGYVCEIEGERETGEKCVCVCVCVSCS